MFKSTYRKISFLIIILLMITVSSLATDISGQITNLEWELWESPFNILASAWVNSGDELIISA